MIEFDPHNKLGLWQIVVFALVMLAAPQARAAEIQPLHGPLSTSESHGPILDLQSGSARLSLSLADLERLPMKESKVKTEFGMEGAFQGVMLDDLLAIAHLTTSASLIVVAADDYAVNINRHDIDASPAMLATRFNGKPIADPNRGPLILIWPKLEQDVLQGKMDGANWVWSVTKIRGGQ